MNNRIRISVDELHRNTYYQLYKFLFTPEFKGLNNDAKVLYSLLRDRHKLSVKNNWINAKGEVYLIFSREDMCEMLDLSENTLRKSINALKQFNLIDEERMGQGKPNRIYMLTVKNVDDDQNLKNCGSESAKNDKNTKNLKNCGSEPAVFEVLDSQKLRASNNNINKNNYSENIPSDPIISVLVGGSENTNKKEDGIRWDGIFAQDVKLVEQQKKEGSRNVTAKTSTEHLKPSPPRYDYNTVEQIIKSDIEYDNILTDKAVDEELLDEICHAIVNTICTEFKDGYIDMGKERVHAEVVRSAFFKLSREEIEDFAINFNKQTEPITKMASYIRTSLFRNHRTGYHAVTNHYYVNNPGATKKVQGNMTRH